MSGMVLLCCFLLCPIMALPGRSQPKDPLSRESQLPILSPLPCRSLLPGSLPSFSRLDPLPRFLISLPLYLTLERAGCPADAHALRQQLYRLGGVKATETLLRQLRDLRGHGREKNNHWVLFSILQLLGRGNKKSGRVSRSLSRAHCFDEKEQQVHSVIHFLPQLGRYYNLGTAFYYAAQDCSAQAWDRGQEAALDLGYDFLIGLSGITGGPGGVVASVALRPVFKAGVQRLIQYYSNKEEASSPSPSTDQRWQKDWRIATEMGSSWQKSQEVTPTVGRGKHVDDEVTQGTSLWNWVSFKSWG
ncbi:apolipoprotein F [Monodelphis domestica]|uniref:apolipoprotein F n=1 Tax=Monodelphis domestica TaxID=13616 RepID=UPI0024E1CC1B|nr:apolipoprotein F [Monodelphis domestica]XP_056653863.1 apolipoprotein F [Monodelphis domestica]